MTRALAAAVQKLGTKLVLIATAFLAIGLFAIGLTLLVSWDLEGGAAAVNQAGAERMRAYRLSMLLSQMALPAADRARLQADVQAEVSAFERAMMLLARGDPARPMFLPKQSDIQRQFSGLQRQWHEQLRPAIESLLTGAPPSPAQLFAYRQATERYVAAVDAMVRAIEQDVSRKTTLLRTLQIGLIWMSIAGTVALIYLMFLLVVRPVMRMEEGMRRMEAGDFDIRLPVETRDEFGALAAGFNRMAGKLQAPYRNLEARVARKTRSLEKQNRELTTLYEAAALLNRPATLEDLCREFVRRLVRSLGADGGAVRLSEEKTGRIHLFVHEQLAQEFARSEACLAVGECHCGEAAEKHLSLVRVLPADDKAAQSLNCRRSGYATVVAIPIQFRDQVLGVYNLYFRSERVVDRSERRLLDSLGRHLGVAIENQRLIAREKEMAVSEERNLLAQELHDSIAQSLAFLNLQAQMLDDSLKRGDKAGARDGLGRIREGIQESYDDVRELLVHFRTRFGKSDLETALRGLLNRFEADTGLATEFRATGTGVPLSPEIQIQALHVVQECLSNVRKHAHANRVRVELERGPVYGFAVSDDGCGFDTAVQRDGHVGLAIMRERAQRIGGRVEVASRPGEGTRVRLTVPIVQEVAA